MYIICTMYSIFKSGILLYCTMNTNNSFILKPYNYITFKSIVKCILINKEYYEFPDFLKA